VELADQSIVLEWFISLGFGVGASYDIGSSSPVEESYQFKTEIDSFIFDWYFDTAPVGGYIINGVWILYSIGNMSFSFYYSSDLTLF
jgi:hypothetical protein